MASETCEFDVSFHCHLLDSMTSSVSTAPYSKETLQTMIGLVKEASGKPAPNIYPTQRAIEAGG